MNTQTTPLTRQQLFDNALMGIRAQGHRASVDAGECVYISANGDRCAIGHSLPASITIERLDAAGANQGATVADLLVEFPELSTHLNWSMDVESFLTALQQIHDGMSANAYGHNADDFERNMHAFADGYKLNYTPLKRVA